MAQRTANTVTIPFQSDQLRPVEGKPEMMEVLMDSSSSLSGYVTFQVEKEKLRQSGDKFNLELPEDGNMTVFFDIKDKDGKREAVYGVLDTGKLERLQNGAMALRKERAQSANKDAGTDVPKGEELKATSFTVPRRWVLPCKDGKSQNVLIPDGKSRSMLMHVDNDAIKMNKNGTKTVTLTPDMQYTISTPMKDKEGNSMKYANGNPRYARRKMSGEDVTRQVVEAFKVSKQTRTAQPEVKPKTDEVKPEVKPDVKTVQNDQKDKSASVKTAAAAAAMVSPELLAQQQAQAQDAVLTPQAKKPSKIKKAAVKVAKVATGAGALALAVPVAVGVGLGAYTRNKLHKRVMFPINNVITQALKFNMGPLERAISQAQPDPNLDYPGM